MTLLFTSGALQDGKKDFMDSPTFNTVQMQLRVTEGFSTFVTCMPETMEETISEMRGYDSTAISK